MSDFAAVLWDMDGTLLDSEWMWDVAVRELSEHLGGRMSEETRVATIGASSPTALGIIFESLGLERHPEALAEAKEWMYSRVEELFVDVGWRPGARRALELAREQGLMSALVTNTERRLVGRALDRLGREFFDHAVCGDDVPNGKPHPDPYVRGAQLLGVEPSNCLAIEDSPTGTAAAEAAGCSVLVVPCEIPVPESPNRMFRTTLEGLAGPDFEVLWSAASRASSVR